MLQRNTSTNAVDSCYAVQLGDVTNGVTNEGNNNLNQEFCSNLGNGGSLYTWDSAANKCVLKNNVCPPKYVFAGVSATGNAICNPMTSYLGYMVDTTGSAACTSAGGTVSLTTDATGKVKISCTSGSTSGGTSGGGTTCPTGTVSWTSGASTCTGSVTANTSPATVSVSDYTAPTTGSATATCTLLGTWSASGSCSTAPACNPAGWMWAPMSSGCNMRPPGTVTPNSNCCSGTSIWQYAGYSCAGVYGPASADPTQNYIDEVCQ